MKSTCPVCLEDMFTSTTKVVLLEKCRHAIHWRCLQQLAQSTYKCPICSKSFRDTTREFELLNQEIAVTPMPTEFAATMRLVRSSL